MWSVTYVWHQHNWVCLLLQMYLKVIMPLSIFMIIISWLACCLGRLLWMSRQYKKDNFFPGWAWWSAIETSTFQFKCLTCCIAHAYYLGIPCTVAISSPAPKCPGNCKISLFLFCKTILIASGLFFFIPASF